MNVNGEEHIFSVMNWANTPEYSDYAQNKAKDFCIYNYDVLFARLEGQEHVIKDNIITDCAVQVAKELISKAKGVEESKPLYPNMAVSYIHQETVANFTEYLVEVMLYICFKNFTRNVLLNC